MEISPKEMAACFSRIADVIESAGWIQDKWSSEEGFCWIGAMRKMCPDVYTVLDRPQDDMRYKHTPSRNARRALRQILREHGIQFHDSYLLSAMIRWNDTRGRTAAEVIALSRDIARELGEVS